jgi:hypothetical protein
MIAAADREAKQDIAEVLVDARDGDGRLAPSVAGARETAWTDSGARSSSTWPRPPAP